MNLREYDQFLVDPICENLYPDGKVLVDAEWLQAEFRKYEELKRLYNDLEKANERYRDTNSSLRHKLVLAESKMPYTVLNVKG